MDPFDKVHIGHAWVITYLMMWHLWVSCRASVASDVEHPRDFVDDDSAGDCAAPRLALLAVAAALARKQACFQPPVGMHWS